MGKFSTLNNLFGWLIAVAGTAVYLLTLEPSVSFWDCGEFIATSYKFQIGHPPGAPLYQLLAHCFMLLAGGQVERLAWWSNALSAVAGGLTAMFLFWTLVRLLSRWQGVAHHRWQLWLSAAVGSACYLFCDTAWFSAVESVVGNRTTDGGNRKTRVIMTSPAGRKFTQRDAEELAQAEHVVFMCGHYEGFDARIETLATDRFSLGDFVMTGGELAAAAMVDATVRLLPGGLGGGPAATASESFGRVGLLEAPQYTHPPEFRGMKVPEVLLGGDHAKIEAWKRAEALRLTKALRPDLVM